MLLINHKKLKDHLNKLEEGTKLYNRVKNILQEYAFYDRYYMYIDDQKRYNKAWALNQFIEQKIKYYARS